MKLKNSPKKDKLIDFIYDNIDPAEISSVESISRFDDGLINLLARAEQASKKSWLANAPANRNKFISLLKDKKSTVVSKFKSREELIKAIESGVLGGQAQQQFQMQFRNRRIDELSDEDLTSIIDDQELLVFLNASKGDSE